MFFRSLQGGGTNMAVQIRYFPIEFPVALGKFPNYRSLVYNKARVVVKNCKKVFCNDFIEVLELCIAFNFNEIDDTNKN